MFVADKEKIKSELLQIRVTPAEKSKINEICRGEKKTVTDFLRESIKILKLDK